MIDNPTHSQDSENMVQIHAPNIDVEAVMTTIRRNIRERQQKNLTQSITFPEFSDVICPDEPADNDHDSLLYFLVREMNQTSTPQFHSTPEIAASALDKIPIVGSVWNILRRHLHSLSIFYTNRMGRQVAMIARYPVVVLNVMTRLNQKRDAEIAALTQRVAELEARLAHLEQKR